MSTPAATTPTHRVVVDTDTGIDDAMALLYLAGQPGVEIAAVTSVYGNCVIDDALRNIGYVLGLAGLDDVSVARGADGPIEGEAHIAHYVHGRDGLGDLGVDRPEPAVVDASSADLLVELANAEPGVYDLLPLGPLTNLGLALERDPQLLTKFRSVVLMGGSGRFPRLGHSLMVDANIQNDPEAARRVFAAPRRRLTSVGVDVTGTVVVDEAAVARLHASGTPWGEFCGAVLESYMDFYRHQWGRRVTPTHDGLAAGVLVHPEYETEAIDGPVNVTSNGYATRGQLMVTADGDPVPWATPVPDTHVVVDVDRPAFLADFLGTLAAGRTR